VTCSIPFFYVHFKQPDEHVEVILAAIAENNENRLRTKLNELDKRKDVLEKVLNSPRVWSIKTFDIMHFNTYSIMHTLLNCNVPAICINYAVRWKYKLQ